MFTCQNIQHWVQAAAYTAHGFRKLIASIEYIGVGGGHQVRNPHEYHGGGHSVVGQKGDHKDEYGGSKEM